MTLALCSECEQEARFTPIGPYRVQCGNCGAVIKNEEIEGTSDDAR